MCSGRAGDHRQTSPAILSPVDGTSVLVRVSCAVKEGIGSDLTRVICVTG